MSSTGKGKLITFEGIDGSGKSTLINRVYDSLIERGDEVLKTKAPGGTLVGEKVREILLGGVDTVLNDRCELFLFLADRAEHVGNILLPALDAGKLILCDRFTDSTLAYQGARGMDTDILKGMCLFASRNVIPDVTFYLDITLEKAMSRVSSGDVLDRIEGEGAVFYKKVTDKFLELAKKDGDRFFIIDASRGEEEIFDQVIKIVYEVIGR